MVPWLLSNSGRDWTKWENKCKSSVPIHLIELLSKKPITGTGGMLGLTSMELVNVVRIFMLLSPSNGERTQLLVNAVSEGLEIINFIEQNSTDMNALQKRKMCSFLWMSRDDSNHWLNKRFCDLSIETKSIDTTQVEEILEKLRKSFHDMYELLNTLQVDVFNGYEAVYLEQSISYIMSKGPFESISDVVNLLEDTACELLRDLLKNLLLAVIEEISNFHKEPSKGRVKRIMHFLYKVEMLQEYINFNSIV